VTTLRAGRPRIDCDYATVVAMVAVSQVCGRIRRMPTPEGDPAAAEITDEQVDAMMLAAQALVGITARSVAEVEFRVTLPQLRLLVLVASRPPMNLNALAHEIGVHPSNATRACDRLVSAGLLRRGESPIDRRNLALELTDESRALIDTLVAHRRRALAAVLAQVPPARRRTIVSAMQLFGQTAGEVSAARAWELGWSG
jgi:DNA-binding MarR family transcriptional regulator